MRATDSIAAIATAPGSGGIGVVRANRFLVDGFLSCSGDRHYEAPSGLFGGAAGLQGKLSKNPGAADHLEWPSKVTGYRMKAGDVVQFTGPSGGGRGDPARRAPEHVLADWLDGFVPLEQARDVYRVVLMKQRAPSIMRRPPGCGARRHDRFANRGGCKARL